MNLYVAPTYINLEKPTFWKHNGPKPERTSGEKKKRPSSAKQSNRMSHIGGGESSDRNREARSGSLGDEDGENINALRKIFSFTSVNLKYVFLQEQYCDSRNPILDIEMKLSSVDCEMDGPSMWQFLGVFKSGFLDRGEKSEDALLIEEAMAKDLKEFKIADLREMIDKEVKNKMGSLL